MKAGELRNILSKYDDETPVCINVEDNNMVISATVGQDDEYEIDDALVLVAYVGDEVWMEYLEKNTDNMQCPKCKSNEHLVLRSDQPEKVSEGYVAACTECDEDFYLMELTK